MLGYQALMVGTKRALLGTGQQEECQNKVTACRQYREDVRLATQIPTYLHSGLRVVRHQLRWKDGFWDHGTF